MIKILSDVKIPVMANLHIFFVIYAIKTSVRTEFDSPEIDPEALISEKKNCFFKIMFLYL